MRVNVVRPLKSNQSRNVTFARKLREDEKKDYTQTLNQAMDYLGVVNRAMIIHGPSFPADKKNNIDQKIGSPYRAEEFLDFIEMHGFNAVQLGPTGKLNYGDNSPYSSSVFAKNPLFINFKELTSERYGSILSDEDIFEETYPISTSDEDHTRTDYKEAQAITKSLVARAHNRFLRKLDEGNPIAQNLNEEFKNFQQENAQWLDYYAVLDVIAQKNKTDYGPNWPANERNLIRDVKAKKPKAVAYYNEIKENNKTQIERYKFAQFLIDKQSKEDDRNHENITYISDLLVGVSSFDEMIFSDVFHPTYKIGAKWGGPHNSPQLWNMALLDPNKLFDKNGALGPSGEFLKMKLKKAMTDASNIRIDHAMGLVNPFVYDPNTVKMVEVKNDEGKSEYYPSRDGLKCGYLSEMGIDRSHNFEKVLSKIIIPTMEEMGIDPKQVVWEDLGDDETGTFFKVFRDKEHLPGISVLAWTRGENSPKENWAYLGCHDNPPVQQSIKNKQVQHTEPWNLDYLAGYLKPHPKKAQERADFINNMISDYRELAKAKWADLFRSTRNIQISFMDFFGIDRQYNYPGTTGDQNWTLRLNSNYEDTYHNSLERRSFTINMPEILKTAVQAKADMAIAKGEKTQAQADRETQELLGKLDHYDKVLKERTKK